jgi:ubiquinone/menaquinone biosynthesis C-methylase UbiE
MNASDVLYNNSKTTSSTDKMRRMHNDFKKELILKNVKKGDCVLDCGAGRGGDLLKWKIAGIYEPTCIDPDTESLAELKQRTKTIGIRPKVQVGDILSVTGGPFDIICYNFSLHYIAPNLEANVAAISRNLKPGGKLIGIVPDPNRLPCDYFVDHQGNTVVRRGDTLDVKLTDGPFYAGSFKSEPILDPVSLKKCLIRHGIMCEVWEPMVPEETGLISDIYSRFIFRR